MSLPVARVNDPISHGGNIIAGSPTVEIAGQMQARETDSVTCIIHGSTIIAPTTSIVTDNGLHIARMGDLTACGASIITTQTTVLAD